MRWLSGRAIPDVRRGSSGVTKLFDKIGRQHVILVWSMWSGYWERGSAVREWAERTDSTCTSSTAAVMLGPRI